MTPTLLERAKKAYWYHSATLDGERITGDYDMEPLVEHYHFPDVTGKTVLDIGAGSGFFSFLFERMGAARVVATDLPRFNDWDVSLSSIIRPDMERNPEQYDAHLHSAFDISHEVYRSKVERRLVSVYDLKAEDLGTFDLVFMGSLLVHLRDPIRALYAVRPLVRGTLVLATPVMGLQPEQAVTYFLADDHHHDRSWWLPNSLCVQRMCKASGFPQAAEVGCFDLLNTRTQDVLPHVVVHANANIQPNQ